MVTPGAGERTGRCVIAVTPTEQPVVAEGEFRYFWPLAMLPAPGVVSKEDGKLVRDAANLSVGENLLLRFAKGGAKVAVEETDPGS